jgi:hypothetical protein
VEATNPVVPHMAECTELRDPACCLSVRQAFVAPSSCPAVTGKLSCMILPPLQQYCLRIAC